MLEQVIGEAVLWRMGGVDFFSTSLVAFNEASRTLPSSKLDQTLWAEEAIHLST